MELHKKSELSLGRTSFVISTQLAGGASPAIETIVTGSGGVVVFETSQDISALKPIFQNSQKVFARLEEQHHSVVEELQQGRIPGGEPAGASSSVDKESDALAHAVELLGKKSFDKATPALRAVLETYPNCSEARELLEVAYKTQSEARLPIDVALCLRRGAEAFAHGRQRDAIESWKQCLIEEPDNRRLQLLLLITTTWSRSRREQYAAEVLDPDRNFLSAGRPEEAQALLLVTQTVERIAEAHPSVAAPQPSAGQETMVIAPPFDDGFIADLIDTETTVARPSFPADAPAAEPPAVAELAREPEPEPAPEPAVAESTPQVAELDETMLTGPPSPVLDLDLEPDREPEPDPDPAPEHAAAASSVPTATSVPAPNSVPTAAPVPTPAPPPDRAAPTTATSVSGAAVERPRPDTRAESKTGGTSAPSAPRATKPKPAPSSASASAATTGPRPAMARRPRPRAKRSNPLPFVAGGAAAVLLLGGALWWFVSRDTSVPPGRLEQAASLVSAGQYPQAITAYDGMIHDFGDDPAILLGRGRAKLASGDTDGGIADLKKAQSRDAQSAAIAEEVADALYSQGRYPDAIGYYEKAFAGGQGTTEGRYRLAVSLVREGRADEAMNHLKQATAKDPSHGEAQFLYGQLLNERGHYPDAEKALRAAEPNVEAGGDYLSQLGIALLEQQKLDEAEEVARNFIRGYPNDARARSLLGEAYLSRKQYEPARAQLIQALRTDPREPRAQLALGRTWLALGRARKDAQDLAKARQVLTTAQGVPEGKRLLALGEVALAEGNLEDSRRQLEQALQSGAPQLPVHLTLAEVKWRQNDLTGSAEELQRASDLAPGDPAIALSLAIAYYQMKDLTRAGDEFLKAIQGIGLLTPPGEGAGPVVLPLPHVPVPERFNLNRAIQDCYQTLLKQTADDPTATELRTLSETTTFLIGGPS